MVDCPYCISEGSVGVLFVSTSVDTSLVKAYPLSVSSAAIAAPCSPPDTRSEAAAAPETPAVARAVSWLLPPSCLIDCSPCASVGVIAAAAAAASAVRTASTAFQSCSSVASLPASREVPTE